jgi:hypothetical protein
MQLTHVTVSNHVTQTVDATSESGAVCCEPSCIFIAPDMSLVTVLFPILVIAFLLVTLCHSTPYPLFSHVAAVKPAATAGFEIRALSSITISISTIAFPNIDNIFWFGSIRCKREAFFYNTAWVA